MPENHGQARRAVVRSHHRYVLCNLTHFYYSTRRTIVVLSPYCHEERRRQTLVGRRTGPRRTQPASESRPQAAHQTPSDRELDCTGHDCRRGLRPREHHQPTEPSQGGFFSQVLFSTLKRTHTRISLLFLLGYLSGEIPMEVKPIFTCVWGWFEIICKHCSQPNCPYLHLLSA
jgi:hypothetical protein